MAGVVVWLMHDILKNKNVDPSLYAVGATIIFFAVAEYMEAGFMQSHIFKILEIVFILLPVYFFKLGNAKLWVSERS